MIMKSKYYINDNIGKLGTAIGRGLIAGFAGTVAITISQMIEQKITNKPASFAPSDAASKALGIEAATREDRDQFSKEVHFTYGTLWGIPRGLFSLVGFKGLPATAAHFAAIFHTAITIEPDFEVKPPINEWSKKEIAVDALHHLVYVVTSGLVFDSINKDKIISKKLTANFKNKIDH